MSLQTTPTGTSGTASQVDRAATKRPRDAWLLVLNVCIVVVGVAIVWDKLRERSGLGEREVPVLDTATLPIPPRNRASGDAGEGVVRAENPSSVAGPDVEPAPGAVASPGAEGAAAKRPARPRETSDQPGEAAPGTRLRGQLDSVPSPAVPREHAAAASVLPLAATEAMIDRIGVDVEVLRTIRGAYPSSSAAAYGSNRGIEALHVALAKVGKVGTLRLGDTDDDGRMEILDAWGRPLVYFSPDDYRSTQRWVPGDCEAVEVGACRVETTQAFHASASYQLFSVGPDGRLGGGRQDDITSWVRSE